MRKKIVLISVLLLAGLGIASAQSDKYEFTTVKELKITPVKNQNRAGTCWSYAGLGFFESELLRMGKGEYDLSEMFIVNHTYRDKADKFVRMNGHANYSQGGAFCDVTYVLEHYGIVPEEVYIGLEYGEKMHVHNELDKLSTAYVNAVVTNPNKKLSPVWKKGFNAIIDSYLGELPEKFTYKGKEYTPKSFAASLGFNFEDYVSLTSFTHHPFYSAFAIEIPDNWRWGLSYNIQMQELTEVIDNAINNGYTVGWATDVSEKGFNRHGIGVLVDLENLETSGSDQAKWIGLSTSQKDAEINRMLEGPVKEMEFTQEERQQGFDNYQTTDDHGMMIYGIAKDQNGKEYYMVKNSWGTDNKYEGTWYVTKAFVQAKTISLLVNKHSIPQGIRGKLSI